MPSLRSCSIWATSVSWRYHLSVYILLFCLLSHLENSRWNRVSTIAASQLEVLISQKRNWREVILKGFSIFSSVRSSNHSTTDASMVLMFWLIPDWHLLHQTTQLEPIKQICCSHLHVAGALWVEAAILIFHVCEAGEVIGVDEGHVNLEKKENTCLLIIISS